MTAALGGKIANLTTASKNVGAYALTPTDSGASALNYRLVLAPGMLSITPAPLTASLTGSVDKTYDGTLKATLTASNYKLKGVFAGDQVSLNDPTLGAYNGADAAAKRTVTVTAWRSLAPAPQTILSTGRPRRPLAPSHRTW